MFEEEEKSKLNKTDEKCHKLEHIDRPQWRLKGGLFTKNEELK